MWRVAGAGLLMVIAGMACAGSDDSDDDALMPPSAETTETTAEPTNVGTATSSNNEEHPPPEDVTLGECHPRGTLGPAATGTLLNQTSKLSNYMISVNFTDEAGVIIASGMAFVNNVPPGSTATWQADSLSMDATAASCSIVKVDRLAAE